MKLSKPSDLTNITFLNWLVGSYKKDKKVSDHQNHAWSFCLAPNCSVSSNCWGLGACFMQIVGFCTQF